MSDGTTTWTYTYDANGMRTSRSDGTTTYNYVYNGSKLTQMTVGSKTLYFTYGVDGSPLAVTFNNVVYFYVTNLQGDVIGIQNTAGVMAAVYYYDAWGNILGIDGMMADTLGILNPLTYRGYVYDHDTGLYYLQSRYYNPEWGRFINPDIFAATGQSFTGNNMFAYCGNNPVCRIDSGGLFWDTVFDVVSLVTSVIEVVNDPTDVGAWVGLALDVVDVVVPCFGGLGEAADAVNAARKVGEAVDDLHDAEKAIEGAQDLTKLNRVVVETKLPTQVKTSEVTELWDEFLGPNQTSFNKFKGIYDPDRIFSADGTRSIRFSSHEMDSLGTNLAHFHYEEWFYGPDSGDVIIFNQLQRIK